MIQRTDGDFQLNYVKDIKILLHDRNVSFFCTVMIVPLPRCFNAVTKSWKEIAPMHARRCYVSTTVLDDMIFAMGGYDGHHRQNTAEKYDHKSNQWTLIAPMNMQRSDASACTLNGENCFLSFFFFNALYILSCITTLAELVFHTEQL